MATIVVKSLEGANVNLDSLGKFYAGGRSLRLEWVRHVGGRLQPLERSWRRLPEHGVQEQLPVLATEI
jgi:hypothetical protein